MFISDGIFPTKNILSEILNFPRNLVKEKFPLKITDKRTNVTHGQLFHRKVDIFDKLYR